MKYPDISFMEEESDSRQFASENETVIVGGLSLTAKASKMKHLEELNLNDPVKFKKGLFRIAEIIYDDPDDSEWRVWIRIKGKFSKDDPNGLTLNGYSELEIEAMTKNVETNPILGLEI